MENNPRIIKDTVSSLRKELEENSNLLKNNPEEFDDLMKKKYDKFIEKYPTIYNKLKEGTLDEDKFEYMINMLSDVKSNKISDFDASVKVGERLVDHYVKPQLSKK